jgi:acetyltransferase-like isoleucine patch superfamily enzyme/dTDP-4-dehydrorhamnose 3,5-epimerase-like enzyme
MDPFVHPQALCESRKIGAGARIEAFAQVHESASVGCDTRVASHAIIARDVVLGDRVVVSSGVHLPEGSKIEDDVFLGPNVAFTNVRAARPDEARVEATLVSRGAVVAANATVLAGASIGMNSVVGAGAVVTRAVPPNAVVVGNPARITGYVDTRPADEVPEAPTHEREAGTRESRVRGVTLHRLPVVRDMRGSLTVGEFPADLPFEPRRYFLVFDVPNKEIRGEHAHRTCHLLLACVRGACSVVVDDGAEREEFRLDEPTLGLHLPPMVWGIQYNYTPDAVLLAFASHVYDAKDYIRDYQQFLQEVKRAG